MKDTSREVEKIYNDMLLKRTPEERLKMGCSMFDLACAIIRSSFQKDISGNEIKQRLFLRLYGADLKEEVKKKVIRLMKKNKYRG
ncbi:MAG: hypothetical protein ABH843_06125 [Candidatus Omnitrophota bacterium]